MSSTNTAVPGKSSIVTRIAKLTDPWANIAPNNKFSGMTLSEFRTEVLASADIRERVTSLKLQLKAEIGAQRAADKAARVLCSQIVSAVKADRMFGANSPLYRAMGFVPTDERKSSKRTVTAPPAPASV